MVRLCIYDIFSLTSKDKLVGDISKAFIENSNISTFTSATFWVLTLTLALAFALAPTLVLPKLYTDLDLKRGIKLTLKSFV